ncbi:unnamed protein product [Prunus armeniaca]
MEGRSKNKSCSTLCADHVGISFDRRVGDFPIVEIALDTHALPARELADRESDPMIFRLNNLKFALNDNHPITSDPIVRFGPNMQDVFPKPCGTHRNIRIVKYRLWAPRARLTMSLPNILKKFLDVILTIGVMEWASLGYRIDGLGK